MSEYIDNPLAFVQSRITFWLTAFYLHFKYAALLILPINLSAYVINVTWPYWDLLAISVTTHSMRSRLWKASLMHAISGHCYFILVCVCMCADNWWNHSVLYAFVWYTVRNQSRLFTMALAIVLIPFLPATNVFFPVGTVIAERLLYLPSLGFCIVIAWMFVWCLKQLKCVNNVIMSESDLIWWFLEMFATPTF